MTILWARPALRSAAVLGSALAALLGGGCVDPDVDVLATSADEPLATSSTVVEQADTLPIGAATVTPRGNTVAVLDAETSEAGNHALVEACAGSAAAEDVGVSLEFFVLQRRDGSAARPVDPADAREPALRTHQLAAGTCTVGWLSFDVAESGSPARYVVFGSQSAATRWEIGDR